MAGRAPRVTALTSITITLTAAVIAGTAGYLVGQFSRLTPMLPVHFARGGLPDRWVTKSWPLVLMPVSIQIALAVVFGTVGALLLWRAGSSPAGAAGVERYDVAPDPDHGRRMRAMAEGIALLSLVWIGFQTLAAVRLVALWERGGGGLGSIYAGGLMTAILVSIAIVSRSLRLVGHSRRGGDGPERDWRMGVLYVNRQDPRLFVPARAGIGYTLNFGRRVAVAILAGVLALGVGVPVLIIRLVTR